MSLSLAIRTPAAAPPGEITRATVTVRNTSQQVLAAQLTVIGVEGEWIELETDEIRLFPNDEGTVGLLIHHPCDASVAAGPHRFAVRAVASHDSAVSVTDEAEIEVMPWPAIEAGLRPRNAHGARRVTTRLTLTNTGNVAQRIALEGGDDDDLVDVALRPAVIELAPGASATARVRVKRAPNAGGHLPYWVRTDAAGPAGAVAAEGAMTVRSRRWSPLPIVLGAAAVIIGIIALNARADSIESAAREASPSTRPDATSPDTVDRTVAPSSGSASVETSVAAPLAGVPEAGSVPPAAGSPKPATAPTGQPLSDPGRGGGPPNTEARGAQPPAPGGGPDPAPAPAVTTPVTPPPTPPPSTNPPPPGAKVPDAPAFVAATAADGSASVTWGAPGNLAAADISSYTLTWSSGSSTFGPQSFTGLSASFTGLTNGAPYTFTVTATSVDGVTGPARSSAAVTPSGVPGTPSPTASVRLGVVPAAIIEWAAVDPNGSPVVSYVVAIDALGVYDIVAGSTTSHQVALDGVPPNLYYATVTATNANGSATSLPVLIDYTCPVRGQCV